MTTLTFTTNTSWTVPNDWNPLNNQIDVYAGGGGGAGYLGGGGGGGGGEYAGTTNYNTTPGTVIPIGFNDFFGSAGKGGTDTGNQGANASFNTTALVAIGGGGAPHFNGSSGAAGTGGTGTTLHNGGTGGTYSGGTNPAGGGGGGAGPTSAGGTGGEPTGGSAGGGSAGTGGGGAPFSSSTNGSDGNNYGAGGGGGGSIASARGGNGGAPAVIITYTPITAPNISSVSPNSCPSGSLTHVTITGDNFINVTDVQMGGVSCPSYSVTNSTSISANTPTSVSGVVNVRVLNSMGTSPVVTADKINLFTAPNISSVSPISGQQNIQTQIVITGDNFVSVSAVKFGATAASSFSVTNATSITANTPTSYIAGTVDVRVLNTAGTSPIVAEDQFTFNYEGYTAHFITFGM